MRSLLIVALLAGVASANGRPPLTNGVYFRPGDAQSIYVRTTFGLIVSHDDGCTFNWLCEQNIGYGGTFDPRYAIGADGTIFAGTDIAGLRISRDGGCTFTSATADLPMTDPNRVADQWIDALDLGPTNELWLGTANGGQINNIYRSTDNGVTFTTRNLTSPTIYWKSVRVAPSQPARVYAAGYELTGTVDGDAGMHPMAHLYRTDDDGDTWTHLPLFGERRDPPTMMFGSTPTVFVMAIDPANPDILLLDSLAAAPPAGDRLYRSTDAGHTFREVLKTTDTIREVIYRDSQHVLVATVAGGSFESSDGGDTYTPMAHSPQLACLGQRGNDVFGCGANWVPDYEAVAKTSDMQSWQSVWRFVDLAGPLACPAGTPEHDMCTPLWTGTAGIQAQFGATGPTCGASRFPDGTVDGAPVVAPPPAGCCDARTGAPVGLVLLVSALLLRRRR